MLQVSIRPKWAHTILMGPLCIHMEKYRNLPAHFPLLQLEEPHTWLGSSVFATVAIIFVSLWADDLWWLLQSSLSLIPVSYSLQVIAYQYELTWEMSRGKKNVMKEKTPNN